MFNTIQKQKVKTKEIKMDRLKFIKVKEIIEEMEALERIIRNNDGIILRKDDGTMIPDIVSYPYNSDGYKYIADCIRKRIEELEKRLEDI